jgi:c-di-GMP-related signal transduction protein
MQLQTVPADIALEESRMISEQKEATLNAPMDAASHRQSRFLARQPILDTNLNVVAYELLFRAGWENVFQGDHNEGTRQVLDNLLVVGGEGLSSNTLVFVNCTRETLVSRLVTLLPPRRTVLEVLETVPPDEEVVASCRALKKLGYRIALDDFCEDERANPLIELANYIKVDFRASDASSRARIRFQTAGSGAALVAEKVEEQSEFATAVAEGFSYFQGYFFCRPTITSREEVPLNQVNSLRLLAAMSRSPLDRTEVEAIVKADAPLCFRLLRLVNSPIFGIRGEVRTVQRALFVLGEDEFRKLATIAIATGWGHRAPHALTSLSLQRARLCELLAPHLHQDPLEQYLMGLFSLLEAILQTPMQAMLKALPLRPPVRAALLGEQNSVAGPLSIARSYETGDWTSCTSSKELLGLDPNLVNKVCLEASNWAEASLPTADA